MFNVIDTLDIDYFAITCGSRFCARETDGGSREKDTSVDAA
jgi:hypothetical protein